MLHRVNSLHEEEYMAAYGHLPALANYLLLQNMFFALSAADAFKRPYIFELLLKMYMQFNPLAFKKNV